MQTDDENDALVGMIAATAEVMGVVISGNAAALIAEDLEKYPFLACVDALKRCRAELIGKITLKGIVERIADGHLDRDEAWGLALQSSDEAATVVWTKEIQAAYEAAKPILVGGDKVGARMAFLKAYDRLLAAAKATGRPSRWFASYGWDAASRELALESAVNLQRLTLSQAKVLGYQTPELTNDGKALIVLLAGPDQRILALTRDEKTRNAALSERSGPFTPSPEFKKRLQQLREDMKQAEKVRQLRSVSLNEARLHDLERRKNIAAAAIQHMRRISQ